MIIKKALVGVFIVFFFSPQEYEIEFNVKNNTEFIINNLNVYSQKFKKLNTNDFTDYKKLMYDELTHNSTISLMVNKNQFIIYMTQPIKEKSTVSIDSLDVKNRIIYYTVLKNNNKK